MPIPPYVAHLREHVGRGELWLPGATAVVLDSEDDPTQVLLVRRSDDGEWTPVTGIVDPGEHPATTAVREAAEEASVEVRVIGLAAVGVTGPVAYPNGDSSRYLDHTFRCVWVSGEARVGDEESTDVRWWSLGALPTMTEQMSARLRRALDFRGRTVLVDGEG